MLKRAIPKRQWAAVTLLAALVFSVLLLRAWRSTLPPEGPSPPRVIVDVVGDVPHPGIHVLAEPGTTVADALAAAGWKPTRTERVVPEGVLKHRLETGERIHLSRAPGMSAEVAVGKMDDGARFVLGFKLDPNTASTEELLLVPGMKPEWARIIVERRSEKPWTALNELRSIHGIGTRTVEKWRPHLEVVPLPSDAVAK
jgi:DNA uptake protein ComE-like DNA-binding protein